MSLPSAATPWDSLISDILIPAAREDGERLSNRSLAKRTFVQTLDSFPYYTDTIQSQLAYPPSYYSLPRYSTTLWNYSQMIALGSPQVLSVQGIIYIGTDGNSHTLNQDVDFGLDRETEPARIFPPVGQYWPACLYVNNAVKINFTTGYDPDPTAIDTHAIVASPPNQQPSSVIVSGIPRIFILGILNLVRYWFTTSGSVGPVPPGIEQIFLNHSIQNFSTTRG